MNMKPTELTLTDEMTTSEVVYHIRNFFQDHGAENIARAILNRGSILNREV